jgi:hypothetical protein
VPDKLQELAGKTQRVERLAGADYGEACAWARTFGVETDAEFKRPERQLADAPRVPIEATDNEPGF